jgi:manganese/zinc/iron transport system permease protein
VVLVELLNKTHLVKEDAAIGLVFPMMFSIGVIMISRNAGNIHIDTDTVLLGELAFAPFNRFQLAGIDLGPQGAWVMGAIFLLNLTFVVVFFKELKLATFDAGLAASLGFLPGMLHYALMSIVSITTVGAFDSVGAILVVALMIGPAATAYLMTDDLKLMLIFAALTGIISAVAGYRAANLLDVSIAGSMATMCGLIFLSAYLFAPVRGLWPVYHRRKRQKSEFAQMTLVMHINNHSGINDDIEERKFSHLKRHFLWEDSFIDKTVSNALSAGLLAEKNGVLSLTDKGKRFIEASDALFTTKYHPGFEALRKEFVIFSDR